MEFVINPKDISNESITVSDVFVLVKKGSVKNPKITIKDNNKALKITTDYNVKYPEVLKDESGNIIAQSQKITITGCGNYTGTRTIDYNVLSNDAKLMSKVRISAKTKNVDYFTQKLPDFQLTYGSDKTKDILEPDKDYTILSPNPLKIGKNIITFVAKEGSSYYGTKTFTINVTGKSIKATDISISGVADAYDFTVDEIRIGNDGLNTLVIRDASTVLKENTDYTLSYKNNINTGKATVIITGIGGYTGKRSISFNINKIKLSEDMFTIINDAVYTKTGAKAEVTAKYNNISLIEKKDYTVTYQNNKKLGNNTATVKIKGKGNFTGEIKKTYNVIASDVSKISFTVSDVIVPKSVSKLKPKISVIEASTNKKLIADKDYIKKLEYFIADESGSLRELKNEDLKSGVVITARLTIKNDGFYDNNHEDDTPVTIDTTFRL